MKRCFIALSIPDETRTALLELQAELGRLPKNAAGKIRPVAPANIHLTIKFLGATPDEQVAFIAEALRVVAARSAPSCGRLEGVDAFPSRARPRAVFASLGAGRQALLQLAEEVESAMAALGFQPENRPRVPHVTIARVEAARPSGPLTEWINSLPARTYGPVDDTRLVLFESELRPGGSLYTPLASLPFGAEASGRGRP